MKWGVVFKVLICSFLFGGSLYCYLGQQNELTKLKIVLPQVAYEVQILEEENTRLRYEVEKFESPTHLMDLAKRCEFSHLRHPTLDEVYVMHTPDAQEDSKRPLDQTNRPTEDELHFLTPRVVIGAR